MSVKKLVIGLVLLVVLVVVVLGLVIAFDKESRDEFMRGYNEANQRQAESESGEKP